MPIKLYDTKDAVPEALRAKAIETKDSKWAVEEVDPALGDAGRKALDDERTARKKAEDDKKAADLELARLKQEAAARDSGVTAEQLQKIRDEEAKARKPIEDENAALKAENRKLKHTDRLKSLALKSGVMEDRIEDAMLVLERRTDLDANGGIVVKKADGTASTESIDEFLGKTFKTEKPYFYAGSGAAGGGSHGSSGEGAGEGAYDPVADGKARAAAQKKTGEQNKLAFQ